MFLRSPRALPAGAYGGNTQGGAVSEVGKRHGGLTLPLAKGVSVCGWTWRRYALAVVKVAVATQAGGVTFGGCSEALGLGGSGGRRCAALSAVGRTAASPQGAALRRSGRHPSVATRPQQRPAANAPPRRKPAQALPPTPIETAAVCTSLRKRRTSLFAPNGKRGGGVSNSALETKGKRTAPVKFGRGQRPGPAKYPRPVKGRS
jgi:hypothetical protein